MYEGVYVGWLGVKVSILLVYVFCVVRKLKVLIFERLVSRLGVFVGMVVFGRERLNFFDGMRL